MAKWYYSKNGQQKGPVMSAELNALAAQGLVTPDDLVWSEGMAGWQPARTLEGIEWPLSPPPIPHITVQTTPRSYAGFWKRFAAALIDGVILSIVGGFIGGIIGFILGVVMGSAGISIRVISLVGMVVGYGVGIILNWLYFTLFESSKKQATPGKMALGIIVTDMSGNPISLGRANGRYWGKVVSGLILLIGYLMAAFTQKKQALHDIMAECLVVNKS